MRQQETDYRLLMVELLRRRNMGESAGPDDEDDLLGQLEDAWAPLLIAEREGIDADVRNMVKQCPTPLEQYQYILASMHQGMPADFPPTDKDELELVLAGSCKEPVWTPIFGSVR